MKTVIVVVGLFVLAAVPASLWAVTNAYVLAFQESNGGVSYGSGTLQLDSAVLNPNTFILTNLHPFLVDFEIQFVGVAGQPNLGFCLSNIVTVLLFTDSTSQILDFNIWTYDRIAVGDNTCPSCVDPYLSGVTILTSTLSIPASNTAYMYNMTLTQIPEPHVFELVFWSIAVLGFARCQRR
jgi:hypothetical protein